MKKFDMEKFELEYKLFMTKLKLKLLQKEIKKLIKELESDEE